MKMCTVYSLHSRIYNHDGPTGGGNEEFEIIQSASASYF